MSRPRRRPVAEAAARTPLRRAAPRPAPGLLTGLVDSLAAAHAMNAALTVERSATPLAPAHLAERRGGTAEERARRRAVYERCLVHYRAVVRPSESETDDVGAAAAHFVAACLAVLRGIRPPDAALRRLEDQLVALVRHGTAWRKSGVVEQQLCFEKLAVLTVLFAAVAKNPQTAPAEVAQARHWAHVYLRELLGLDPATLTIDDGGLAVLRERRAA